MHQKSILACMAIAAFSALVMAPAASASPVLTSNGIKVPVGTSITGESTGTTLFSGSFSVECSTAVLKGTVTKNSGTKIAGEIPAGNAKFTGTGAAGDCTSALGPAKVTVNSKLCLETDSTTADTEIISGCGSNVTFTLEVTGTGGCKYTTASVSDTYTTNTTPAVTTIFRQGAQKEEGGVFCPSSGELNMTFDRYATDGTPLATS